MAKITAAQIASGLVSSSLNNTPALTPSGSATVAYSTNNNTITLAPGVYIITATASGKMVITQDSSFGVEVFDGSSVLVADNFGSLSTTSATVWPVISAQGTVTLATQTTLTVRIRQTFGSGATVSNLATSIQFTKIG